MFVSISSFTSVGYSTISGETFSWRPTLYSTLSTTAGFASFISSSSVLVPGTNPPVGVPMSTSGNDLYFSSVTFSTNHLMKYLDTHRTSSTRMFVELQPSFFFPPLYQVSGGDSNVVKEISSYLQLETVISGRVVFETSVNTRYITSQITDTNLSNYFNTPMRMEINPYEIASNVDRNSPSTVNLTVYHRIVNGLSNVANPGFLGPTVNYDDRTSKGLYIQMMSDTQLYP
jgi:predicted RND superfamily exporter protein